MARRSYLQRIAEPLRARDPVLFAVPSAWPEDARPAATASVTDTTAAAPAPVLRRAPPRPTLPIASPPPESASRTTETLAPSAPETSVVANQAHVPNAPVAEAVAGFAQVEPQAIKAATDINPIIPGQARAFPQDGPAISRDTQADPANLGFHDEPPLPSTTAPQTFPSAPLRESTRSPGSRNETSADIAVEPISRQPPPAAAATRKAAPEAAAPRIHIGTVEVRSAPPTPVPAPTTTYAAPRTDAAPISRAYAWRFGLVQG